MGVYRLGILKGERVYNFWGSVVGDVLVHFKLKNSNPNTQKYPTFYTLSTNQKAVKTVLTYDWLSTNSHARPTVPQSANGEFRIGGFAFPLTAEVDGWKGRGVGGMGGWRERCGVWRETRKPADQSGLLMSHNDLVIMSQ